MTRGIQIREAVGGCRESARHVDGGLIFGVGAVGLSHECTTPVTCRFLAPGHVFCGGLGRGECLFDGCHCEIEVA